MKSGKAPGLDGIPMEAFEIQEGIASETILDPLNSVISGKQFPKDWKKAKLVLVPKVGCTDYLDVREAFNSASWDIILQKLEARGVTNYLLEIVDSYLGGRSLQI
ncbi:hypothetical protein JTB14_014202 [Gonioctena quinquepunctata]|nr:hypothetical protein JTB14_014202 [Gonioctena quinquepunctata]